VAVAAVAVCLGPLALQLQTTEREWLARYYTALGALGALCLTWQNTRATVRRVEQQAAEVQTQLEMAKAGQLAERFAKAVEQLAHENIGVRVGGAYALEGVATDAQTEGQLVQAAEVLCGHVRHWLPMDADTRTMVANAPPPVAMEAMKTVPSDVQAVMSVIGRMRRPESGCLPLNLTSVALKRVGMPSADLRGADLSGAYIGGADLTHAILRASKLADANMYAARLAGADLSEADLGSADLRNAWLCGASLRGATLEFANLQQADLSHADLSGCAMLETSFDGANLRNARLVDSFGSATFAGADLRGAVVSADGEGSYEAWGYTAVGRDEEGNVILGPAPPADAAAVVHLMADAWPQADGEGVDA
jgi:hypothetical protein